MADTYCFYCFSSLDGGTVCPQCGAPAKAAEPPGRAISPGAMMRERYLLGHALTQDALGITYFGYDRQQRKQVWVREYLPEGLSGRLDGSTDILPLQGDAKLLFENGKELFMQRAKEMAQYNVHPGMTKMECYFEENGTGYIVMERTEGESLAAYMKARGGKLEWFNALQIMSPIFSLLQKMHKGHSVQGYVSPDNIYVDANGQGRLLCFNILGDNQALPLLNARYLPQGLFEGKKKIGPWVDVYGMAATLYQMVVGERPMPATDPMTGQIWVDRPSQKGSMLPPRVEEILLQVLCQNEGPWAQSIETLERGLLGLNDAPAGMRIRRQAQSRPIKKKAPRPRNENAGKAKKWIWLGPLLGVAAAIVVILTLTGIRYFGAQGLYQDGMDALRMGKTSEAVAAFKQAMDRFPWADQKYEEMYHQTRGKDFAERARKAMESGSYEKAINLYEQAIKEDPQNDEYTRGKQGAEKYKEGYLLYSDGEFAKAKLSFEAALGIDPANSHISGLIAGIEAWSEGRDAYHEEDYEAAFNAYSKALEYDEDNEYYIDLCDDANRKWEGYQSYELAMYYISMEEYLWAYEEMLAAAEADPDTTEYQDLADGIYILAEMQFFYEVLQENEYTDTRYIVWSKITKGPGYEQSLQTLPEGWDCLCISLDTYASLRIRVEVYYMTGFSEEERTYLGGGDDTTGSAGSWIYWEADDASGYASGNYCFEVYRQDSNLLIAREYVRIEYGGE